VRRSQSLHLEGAKKFGTRFFLKERSRVRRSTAIGVSENARGIPHRISKRFFWRCRSNEKPISKVSNHRKNKGFELLPGLEPWAVPAARQETSDMGFTFAMKALPAGKARRVSRVR